MSSATPSGPLWAGDYVVWWNERDWEYHSCVICRRSLSSSRRVRGYHYDCLRPGITTRARQALGQDQRAFRAHQAGLAPPSFVPPPVRKRPTDEPTRSQRHDLQVLARRTRTTVPPNLTRADASALLATLKATLAAQPKT